MSGMTNYLPMAYSPASDDDSDFEIVPVPKSKTTRKRSTAKPGSSASRPARGKGKVVREPRSTPRLSVKAKKPLAVLEEELFEDDESPSTTKTTVKRNYNKKTSATYTSDEDEIRSTKPSRESKKASTKKRPTPQRETSEDDDDSVMDEGSKPTKKRKSQVSENADTFIDLSPKTTAFESLPTFSCFIGKNILLFIYIIIIHYLFSFNKTLNKESEI